MKGLIKNYSLEVPNLIQCGCGTPVKSSFSNKYQTIYTCSACKTIIEYTSTGGDIDWELGEVTQPEHKPKTFVEDNLILQSLILKLDAIANHLGVELVNVPEQYICEDDKTE